MSAKGRILMMLKEAAPAPLSGEALGRSLGLTRAAIWKVIRGLREEGYEISSSPRLGYGLIQAPDLLVPAEVEPLLRTRCFGRRGIHHSVEIGSTNDRAKELAHGGAPEGTLVVAESQSAGRGRFGRAWASPGRGGLYLSLILRPSLAPSEAPQITLLAGVGVCRAINALTPVGAGIKWPNDVLIKGKKVAGILTEMEAEMDRIHHLIVGIGINVNTRMSFLPRAVRERATSLLEETGKPISRKDLLAMVLAEMEALWAQAERGGFDAVRAAWKRLNVTLGRRVRIEGMDVAVLGTAMDLDDRGALLVRAQDGPLHRIPFGEVSLLSVGE